MIDEIINRVIEREGGYVNHSSDRGGATKYGITRVTLAAYRRKPVTEMDVMSMTDGEARAIYRKIYWDDAGLDTLSGLHPLIVEHLFDIGVNHGTRTAVKLIQRAAGVTDDGILGKNTRAAVERTQSKALASNLAAQRVIEYGRIITANPSQAVFAHGWARRVAEFITKIGVMS